MAKEGIMKVGDLVTHIDRKDYGTIIKTLGLHGKNRVIWVYWSDGDTKDYQSDYYLKEVVCK